MKIDDKWKEFAIGHHFVGVEHPVALYDELQEVFGTDDVGTVLGRHDALVRESYENDDAQNVIDCMFCMAEDLQTIADRPDVPHPEDSLEGRYIAEARREHEESGVIVIDDNARVNDTSTGTWVPKLDEGETE